MFPTDLKLISACSGRREMVEERGCKCSQLYDVSAISPLQIFICDTKSCSYKLDELRRHHLRQQLGTEELAALCSQSEPSSPPLIAYRSPQAHS